MLMSGRRPLRESVNPIDQVDLENLKRWTRKNPYIKSRDHGSVLLQYRKLTIEDLPDDCGFDKYGLVVRREFAATVNTRPITLLPKDGHETSSLAARERESHRSMSAEQLGERAPSSLPSACSTATEGGDGAISSPTVSVNIFDIDPTPFDRDTTVQPRHNSITDALGKSNAEIAGLAMRDITTSPSSEDASDNDNASIADGTLVSGTERTYLRTSARIRSAPPSSYQGHSTTRSHARTNRHTTSFSRRLAAVHHSTAYTNSEATSIQCHCPPELPESFLEMLERDDSSITPDAGFILVQQFANYNDILCYKHLKLFANWAATAISHWMKPTPVVDMPSSPADFSCTPSRRRSSSVPDIMHDLPPTKKRRLATSLTSEAEEYTKTQDQIRSMTYSILVLIVLVAARGSRLFPVYTLNHA